MSLGAEFGPLAALAGTWEGDEGVDVSFLHSKGEIGETRYRERATFNPFGPVDNGTQCLYGLDYRMAAWRGVEADPFHTEVGYWLWDGGAGQLMRCFMVPRGSTILAGGPVESGARAFTLRADVGSETYGILSNPHLARTARTTRYQVVVTFEDDGSWSYSQTTTIEHARLDKILEHTDRNRLRRAD